MPAGIDQLLVVLIDDDPDHLELLGDALRSAPNAPRQVHVFHDPAEAIAHMPSSAPLAIVCDYSMPGGTGVDWLPDLLKPGVGPVILLTANGSEHVAAEAFRLGAADYLVKSEVLTQPHVLIDSIRDAVRRHHLEHSVRQLSHKLKLANHTLEASNSKLSALTRTAHRFVDNVAHEFRTPLAVIQEFSSIIGDGIGGPVTPQQQEYLGFIASATHDLAQMVDDFLDSSRLKARTLRVDRRAHQAEQIVDAVLPAIRMRGEAKRITIEAHVEPGLSDAFCDSEKVGRILVNLAVNAIKFSPEGRAVRLWADAGNGNEVRLGVTDHGAGLSEEDLAVIGERFKQVGDPHETSTKGFGLGLNIAKELVALNLGRMQITSKRGEGSTFAFTLPTCDPDDVLKRYVTTMQDHCEVKVLSLLRAVPREKGPIDVVRQALSKLSYPMDLVLATTDESAVLLLGATEEPDRWIERLSADYARVAESRRSQSDRLSAIDLSWVRSWQPSELTSTTAGQVYDALVCLPHCA